MRSIFRRETFIALRARRQGHQVASEILNPHMEIPEARAKVLPVEDLHRHPWDDQTPRPPEPPPEWHKPVDLPDWLKTPHVNRERVPTERSRWIFAIVVCLLVLILFVTIFHLHITGALQ